MLSAWPGWGRAAARPTQFCWADATAVDLLASFSAATPPRPLPVSGMPKQGVTLSDGRLFRYSKPPLSIPDQLQQLRDRGLLVESDDLALNALGLVGYYRLSAYWLFFEEPPAPVAGD